MGNHGKAARKTELHSSDALLKEHIRAEALRLGFDAIGFSPARISDMAKEHLREFLARGYHGDMGWLEDRSNWRENPREMWEDARSVIVLGCNYSPAEDPLKLLEHPDRGNISVYARNRDYHDFVKKRLKALARWIVTTIPDCQVKVFVDTAPVMEKVFANQGGLGWQGKNTHLVSREHGSWLFLGEIYISLDLEPDAAEPDHCGRCSRCLDVCPTKAFPAPYVLDGRRCISYLTIENKGHIAEEFRKPIGNRIYGCDDCIAVCPWNKFADDTLEPNVFPRIELTAPKLVELVQLSDADFRQVFSGSPIKRIGRNAFVRNVLIALGNSGDSHSLKQIYPLLRDSSPLVRAMAVWACRQLSEPEAFHSLKNELVHLEDDKAVIQEWEWNGAA
ncbi:tRNA epoxyqueuosine(34) reductase QueG [Kiloniella sp. b19]|uniref:tRNA epoxyqueuosine(34) reductase QueG n=1 Tax=Kiloniella sp. GXU_MW_B19 TaxID=3141326 RepID=UPI0031D18F3E